MSAASLSFQWNTWTVMKKYLDDGPIVDFDFLAVNYVTPKIGPILLDLPVTHKETSLR